MGEPVAIRVMRAHAAVRGFVVVVVGLMSAVLAWPVAAAPKKEVVYESIRSGPMNSFFEWSPRYFPQIGQSITITSPVRLDEVRVFPDESSRWKKLEYAQRNEQGEYDQAWVQSNVSGKVPVDTTLEIWRYLGDGVIPAAFNTREGFENVYRGQTGKDLRIGNPYSIPVKPAIVLQPGRYFVSLGMVTPDANLSAIRFKGQQNGTNTKGGFEHDVPNPPCKYKPTRDSSNGDRAFRLDASDQPPPGPPPATVNFGTTFAEQDTKVSECAVAGLYGDESMIWNPGDLQMELIGGKVAR